MAMNKSAKVLASVFAVSNLVACAPGGSSSGPSSSGRMQVVNQSLQVSNGAASSQSFSLYAPNLTLVGQLTPPAVNGVTLQANQSQLFGLNLYVSYNIAGAASGGGVDVVSVASPLIPALSQSAQFATLDVNNVFFAGTSIYVAGNDSVADSPARLQKYSSTLLGASNALVADTPLFGYATTAVKGDLAGTFLYALTGDNGGLHILNRSDLSEVTSSYTAISDARDVAVSAAGDAYVVSGGASAVVEKFSALGVYQSSVSLGSTGATQSKSTITAGGTYALASAGAGGIKLICLANMSVIGSAPAPTGGLTNGAAFAGGLVFTADGDSGVGVYSLNQGAAIASTTCNNATLTKLGTIAFSGPVSANHISYSGGFLFVSSGLGGLQIVSVALPSLVTGLITSL